MSASSTVAIDGRSASRARRQALSIGKSALPPSNDRVRRFLDGDETVAAVRTPESAPFVTVSSFGSNGHGAASSNGHGTASSNGHSAASSNGHSAASSNGYSAASSNGVRGASASGRQLSLERRLALSAGKAALPPSRDAAPAPARDRRSTAAASAPAVVVPSGPRSAHEIARARRAQHSRHGRGDALPAGPTRPPRGGIVTPPVIAAPVQPTLPASPPVAAPQPGVARVTGGRVERIVRVTGNERGATRIVSGTFDVDAAGAAWRSGGPKVGLARTERGTLVSGTLVRSRVSITGDEAGGAITVTGTADQRIDDDLTVRRDEGASPTAQFWRQAQPHGQAVHGNLGRSARAVGSRARTDMARAAVEATEGGLAITGTDVGRGSRVTGADDGSSRVTGDHYVAPARSLAVRGGRAPNASPAVERPAPLTAMNGAAARALGGRRVTGIDVEQHPRVSGTEPGSNASITGSSYQGFAPERRRSDAAIAVTGDTPHNDALVSGTARGAALAVTGTPYYAAENPAQTPTDPIAAIDDRFSVRSPQRAAQRRAAGAASPAHDRITGSFASGNGKLTGNLEFVFRPRPPADGTAPAHARLTGEGRATGRAITGDAWSDTSKVTGTENAFAGARNPSERGGKPRPFAGSSRFKALASHEEPKHLVTGMFGYASDSAAKVTLSGGAQG